MWLHTDNTKRITRIRFNLKWDIIWDWFKFNWANYYFFGFFLFFNIYGNMSSYSTVNRHVDQDLIWVKSEYDLTCNQLKFNEASSLSFCYLLIF